MGLNIGILYLNIFFKIETLKDRRALVNRIREIANTRFNLSFAELSSSFDFANVELVLSSVALNKELIESSFNSIISILKQIEELSIIKEQRNVSFVDRES